MGKSNAMKIIMSNHIISRPIKLPYRNQELKTLTTKTSEPPNKTQNFMCLLLSSSNYQPKLVNYGSFKAYSVEYILIKLIQDMKKK